MSYVSLIHRYGHESAIVQTHPSGFAARRVCVQQFKTNPTVSGYTILNSQTGRKTIKLKKIQSRKKAES